MEISHEIKKRRTELNITQEELAERLNVTRPLSQIGK
ncbi:helix-turn-helix domain-containing protein [Carnobacterium mobile]|nr:helix-turn-helix domain-containing protein [Carnobacterium mobile]